MLVRWHRPQCGHIDCRISEIVNNFDDYSVAWFWWNSNVPTSFHTSVIAEKFPFTNNRKWTIMKAPNVRAYIHSKLFQLCFYWMVINKYRNKYGWIHRKKKMRNMAQTQRNVMTCYDSDSTKIFHSKFCEWRWSVIGITFNVKMLSCIELPFTIFFFWLVFTMNMSKILGSMKLE